MISHNLNLVFFFFNFNPVDELGYGY
jgi:hypothetical protein